MERMPNGRYTKVFQEEAVKMATHGGLSVTEVSMRLSLPKSTLERWIKVSSTEKPGDTGTGDSLLREIENELAAVKLELLQARMERDILEKTAAYFARQSPQNTR